MRSNIVIPQHFLSTEAVKLGRLVRNVDEPQQDYFDPSDEGSQPQIIATPQLNYSEVRQDWSDKGFEVLLTRLVSASRTRKNGTFTEVSTDRIVTYQLANSGLWFKEAVKTEKARKWMEDAISQGDDLYVVVGYHTMVDARVVQGAAVSHEHSAEVIAPVSESLAAAGVVLPIAETLDVGVDGHNNHGQAVMRQFAVPGEQICAVQYRKVRFSWFSSRDVAKATLEKDNRWKIYYQVRGQEEGVDDVLEADLQDDLELEDGWEAHKSEESTVYF